MPDHHTLVVVLLSSKTACNNTWFRLSVYQPSRLKWQWPSLGVTIPPSCTPQMHTYSWFRLPTAVTSSMQCHRQIAIAKYLTVVLTGMPVLQLLWGDFGVFNWHWWHTAAIIVKNGSFTVLDANLWQSQYLKIYLLKTKSYDHLSVA